VISVVVLSPEIVTILNALAGDGDREAALFAIDAQREAARDWLARWGGYTIDEQEVEQFNDIGLLWGEIEKALASAMVRMQPERMVPALYQVFSLMVLVQEARERPHFSQHVPIDDFLMAGVACGLGRANVDCVAERLSAAVACVDELEARCETAGGLEDAVRADLALGFAALRGALPVVVESARNRDAAALEAALARVKAADEVVARFTTWERNEAWMASRATSLPAVAERVRALIEALRTDSVEVWKPLADEVVSRHLPAMRGECRPKTAGTLMPGRIRATCLPAVDAALEGAETVVVDLVTGAIPPERAAQTLEAELLELSAAMSVVERHAFPSDALFSRRAERYWALLSGLLAGTIPAFVLREALGESTRSEVWAPVVDLMAAYAVQADPELLCEAAERILTLRMSLEEQDEDQWTCRACGFGNDLTDTSCGKCGMESVTPKWGALS